MQQDLKILIEYNEELFPSEFVTWLENNEHIWEAFARQAKGIADKGVRHYSARTILHFLRHHSVLTETGSEWKINDHHSPYLARLFDLRYPSYAGLFEYRKTTKNDLPNA